MIDVDLGDVAALLLARLPQLVWAADADGNLTYVNERWSEYTGIPSGALLGSGWTAAIAPGQRDAVVAGWKADVAAGAGVSEHRSHYRRFDGEYRWFLWRANPIADAAGTITQWVGTHTDIDAQARAEAELSANEERYRSILETTQEGVWIVDRDARTRYANRRFAEMLGYARSEELFGISAYELFRVTDHPMITDQLARRRGRNQGIPLRAARRRRPVDDHRVKSDLRSERCLFRIARDRHRHHRTQSDGGTPGNRGRRVPIARRGHAADRLERGTRRIVRLCERTLDGVHRHLA